MPFAILITILLGVGQYISYGQNDLKMFVRQVIYPLLISLVVGIIGFFADSTMSIAHAVFLVCITFTILTSLGYLFRFAGGKSNAGAAITHFGFGIFLLGVLLTFANTEVLSKANAGAMAGGGENIMLFKGQVKQMGKYHVCYSDSKIVRDETFYQVDFLKKGADDKFYLDYSVFPSIKVNAMMGNVHNPDTRNMLKGDIFMYLTYAEDQSKRTADGYLQTDLTEVSPGDTLKAGGISVIFDSLSVSSMDENATEVTITAIMKTIDNSGKASFYPLIYQLKGGYAESGMVNIGDKGVKLSFAGVSDKAKTIQVGVYEKQQEFIVARIMFFPWIWVLWAGSIIMFSGVTVSIWRRAVKAKQAAE
jgi:cytochrome c-type biogenesis protein CcmF